ncbi:MAG: hypothetical protein WD768_07530 [Phycisphaeraceae bacterium]
MIRRLGTVAFILLVVGALLLGYWVIHGHLASQVLRDRIETLAKDYESLRNNFNEAVKKTVVTEFLVQEDGTICVVFVSADGSEQTRPTPYKRGAEVYADYIIKQDGRLLLRRVYDQLTAPIKGVSINTEYQTIENWKEKEVIGGIAASGQLNEVGRWVVKVSGQGAMLLTKADDKEPRVPLLVAPTVKDYSQVTQEVDASIGNIGPGDVFKALVGGGK